jgi:hypothetical protein
MSSQFEPSPASITPRKKALLTLRYVRKAVDALEAQLLENENEQAIPSWVLTRINQGASCLGSALSYVSFKPAKVKAKAKKNPDTKEDKP